VAEVPVGCQAGSFVTYFIIADYDAWQSLTDSVYGEKCCFVAANGLSGVS
jgi:hypothetical protein